MATIKENILELPQGRSLAYTDSGNAASSTVVLFFHGVFSVGDAAHLSTVLLARDVHYVAPTLPGWGNSSPIPSPTPYHIGLASDATALIHHLHPGDTNLKLYVAGGSYGTVPAQMLYGAPFDIFPPGRYIAGCLVLAPFSPFRWHKDYTKTMTMSNYFSVGPPAHNLPFRLLQRLAAFALSGKLKTEENAKKLMRSILFDNMEKEERATFKKWSEAQGRTDGEVEGNMAKNAVKSVAQTWDGFLEVCDVLHSDWGFRADALDDEHTKRPLLAVASAGDKLAPDAMAKWLAVTYKNGHLKSISGGHLAALFHLDEIWTEFFDLAG